MKSQQSINFLSSLDGNLPITIHFRNCLRDALSYKWPSSIVLEIFEGIEDAYKDKK